jgi:hypothetical protein
MSIVGAHNVKDHPYLIRLYRQDGEGQGKTQDLILNRLEALKAIQMLQSLLNIPEGEVGRSEMRSEAHPSVVLASEPERVPKLEKPAPEKLPPFLTIVKDDETPDNT